MREPCSETLRMIGDCMGHQPEVEVGRLRYLPTNIGHSESYTGWSSQAFVCGFGTASWLTLKEDRFAPGS